MQVMRRSIGFSRLGLCKCEGAATGGQSAFSQTIHLRQGYGGQAAKKGTVPGVARASRMALKPRRMAGCPWRAASPAYCGEYRCRMEGPGFSPARVGRGPAPRSALKPMLLNDRKCAPRSIVFHNGGPSEWHRHPFVDDRRTQAVGRASSPPSRWVTVRLGVARWKARPTPTGCRWRGRAFLAAEALAKVAARPV